MVVGSTAELDSGATYRITRTGWIYLGEKEELHAK